MAELRPIRSTSFWLRRDANKIEIKQAIEEIFSVKVDKRQHHPDAGQDEADRLLSRGPPPLPTRRHMVKLTADSKTIEFFEGMV